MIHSMPCVFALGPQLVPESLMRVRELAPATVAILDLSAVRRVNWMALALLVDCRERLLGEGGELALAGVTGQLGDALHHLGLDGRLLVYDSVEAAHTALASR